MKRLFSTRPVRPFLLEAVEVYQQEEPIGLLGVVEFCRAARFFAEARVVDDPEGLLKHSRDFSRVRHIFGHDPLVELLGSHMA